MELPVELLAFVQLLDHVKLKKEPVIYDRRKSSRRNDRRKEIHRRVSVSSDINLDELNRRENDRRDIQKERRRRDRRALERIQKI